MTKNKIINIIFIMFMVLFGLLGAGAVGLGSLATVAGVSSGAIAASTGVVTAGFGATLTALKVSKNSSAGSGLGGAFKHALITGNVTQKLNQASNQTVMGAIGSGGIGMKAQRRLQLESSAMQATTLRPPIKAAPTRD